MIAYFYNTLLYFFDSITNPDLLLAAIGAIADGIRYFTYVLSNPPDVIEATANAVTKLYYHAFHHYCSNLSSVWHIIVFTIFLGQFGHYFKRSLYSVLSLMLGLFCVVCILPIKEIIIIMLSLLLHYCIFKPLYRRILVKDLADIFKGLMFLNIIIVCYLCPSSLFVKQMIMILSIKMLDLTHYYPKNFIITFFHFFGFMLNPTSLLLGQTPSMRNYVLIQKYGPYMTEQWFLNIFIALFKSFVFFNLHSYGAAFLIPDNGPSFLVAYRLSFQARAYYYYIGYLCEATASLGGHPFYDPRRFKLRSLTKHSFLEVEFAGSLNTALIFFENHIATIFPRYHVPIQMLFAENGVFNIRIHTFLKITLIIYLCYDNSFLIAVMALCSFMWVQKQICREVRRQILHRDCFVGCCVNNFMQTAKAKNEAMKLFKAAMKICNHIYITCLFLEPDKWDDVCFIHFIVFILQLLYLIILKWRM